LRFLSYHRPGTRVTPENPKVDQKCRPTGLNSEEWGGRVNTIQVSPCGWSHPIEEGGLCSGGSEIQSQEGFLDSENSEVFRPSRGVGAPRGDILKCRVELPSVSYIPAPAARHDPSWPPAVNPDRCALKNVHFCCFLVWSFQAQANFKTSKLNGEGRNRDK
jgi:hypothetical protein